MIKSNFELEKKLMAEGYDFIIGVDEAGRGPLAGPVIACACVYKSAFFEVSPRKIRGLTSNNTESFRKKIKLIRDSKTLSEKQRESLFDFIQENFYIGIGICNHKTIDRINILEASFLAMKSAISQLKKDARLDSRFPASPARLAKAMAKRTGGRGNDNKTIILLDGNKKIPNFSLEQRPIVSGDKFIKSISAASIFAKVTRDRMMIEYHKKYPEYNFQRHKGYGTRIHMEALQKFGPCEIHRKSFRPVRKCLLRGVS